MSFREFAEVYLPKVNPPRKEIPWGVGVIFKIKIGTPYYAKGYHTVEVSDSTRVVSRENGNVYYKSDCIVVAPRKGNK